MHFLPISLVTFFGPRPHSRPSSSSSSCSSSSLLLVIVVSFTLLLQSCASHSHATRRHLEEKKHIIGEESENGHFRDLHNQGEFLPLLKSRSPKRSVNFTPSWGKRSSQGSVDFRIGSENKQGAMAEPGRWAGAGAGAGAGVGVGAEEALFDDLLALETTSRLATNGNLEGACGNKESYVEVLLQTLKAELQNLRECRRSAFQFLGQR